MDGAGVPETIGPFRVVRRLGAGGMAEAFEAARSGPGGFEQRVCVKRVLPSYSTDPEFMRLFLREARLAASLSHRNITRVVDFGEDRGCHYLALELVEGMDVRRLLKAMGEHAALPPDVVALIGIEIADALEHAHTRTGKTGPVVHRDVSPANILVSTDGDVRLTDFGISKALNDAPATRTDFVRGNIWYMAPEQIEGASAGPPDPRSDLFSLGIVLYQALAGRRPYDGLSDVSAMLALSMGRRAPLGSMAPGAPEPLVAIIEQLLAQHPEHRFQRAAAVAEALSSLTHVASARRRLMQLVRDHRHVQVRPRAAVALEPGTLDLKARAAAAPEPREDAGDQARRAHARVRPAIGADPLIPHRWRRYALAPRMWASAERAAAQREAEGRPVVPAHPVVRAETPPADDAPVELPGARRGLWIALAAASVLTLALGSCLTWMLW